MIWKYINTGFQSGSFNMKFDEELASQLTSGVGSTTLRIYGWQPSAISIGFNQKMEDFDTVKLFKAGIDIVRRPTGGKAILHAHELTYSVVMKLEDRGPREIYRFINECLLSGLKYLGIEAHLSDKDDDFKKLYQTLYSIPCFSSSAKSEIQYNGQKLVGSAQRRYGTVILQHGSLLLGPQHQKIVEFLAPHIQNSREILIDILAARTIDVETILDRRVTFHEAAAAIKQGFEDQGQIIFDNSAMIENVYR